MTLHRMRELATYPVTILFGVAVAGVLARVIALWWPRAGVATFIVLASAWALVGAAKMLRALRGGRNSALAIIFERIGAFCPVFGLALLIGELFARIGSDARLRTPSLRSLNCLSQSRHRNRR